MSVKSTNFPCIIWNSFPSFLTFPQIICWAEPMWKSHIRIKLVNFRESRFCRDSSACIKPVHKESSPRWEGVLLFQGEILLVHFCKVFCLVIIYLQKDNNLFVYSAMRFVILMSVKGTTPMSSGKSPNSGDPQSTVNPSIPYKSPYRLWQIVIVSFFA